MTRPLKIAGSVLVTLVLVLVVFFFWASSGRLTESELATTKTYAPSPDTTAPDTLRVMGYNIGYLSGMTNNRPVVRSESLFTANMEQVVNILRESDPDVVGLQEVDFGAARSFHLQQLDTLATRLRYPVAAQAVNWDERYLPFPYGRPAVNFGRTLSGQGVLSRIPVRQHYRGVLPRPQQVFFRDAFYLDRLAQVTVLDVGGRALGVINVHLEAFATETRERQARTVNEMYDRLAGAGLPVLVIGDFNSTLGPEPAADSTFQILLDETSLRPARGDMASATYPADTPSERLDYIFYPPRAMTPVDTRRQCAAPNPPADHCAVATSFLLSSPSKWPRADDMPPLADILNR